MKTVTRSRIEAWIASTTVGILSGSAKLGIGSDVVRGPTGDGSAVAAVAGDAPFGTQVDALVDLLSWQHAFGLQVTAGRLVIGDGPHRTRVIDALSTLRDALKPAVNCEPPALFVLDFDGTLTPLDAPAPSFACAGGGWGMKFDEWDAILPTGQAGEFVNALAGGEGAHLRAISLHPDLTTPFWSIRIDGIRVGRIHRSKEHPIRLEVGAAKEAGVPNKDFVSIAGGPSIETESIDTVIDVVSKLAKHWRTKPGGHGQPEHALEAAILRGDAEVTTLNGVALGRVDVTPHVLRAAQFPCLWSTDPGARARYLDVVMRTGSTPWAAELKIPSGGGGRQYRHAITQTVLYAAFIRGATPVHGWFSSRGLDAAACRPAIVVPPDMDPAWKASLLAVADRFDVEVAEVAPPAPYAS
jgi:hypothetical protein